MNKWEFGSLYKSNVRYIFGIKNYTTSTHLSTIINDAMTKKCSHTSYWNNTIPLPDIWINSIKNKNFNVIITGLKNNNNLNLIHYYKKFGLSHTEWDYTEYFKELPFDLVEEYKKWYENADPKNRSLICFLNTHENGIWILIDWNNKRCEKLNTLEYIIDFTKGESECIRSLNQFKKLINSSLDIFSQPNDKSNNTIFSKVLKEIIKTKTWGKIGVQSVVEDLKKKNIEFILTDSGDLLDINWGIDIILLNTKVIGKTSQIKKGTIKTHNSELLLIYCGGIKDYLVDFFSIVDDENNVRYFRNNSPKIGKGNLYYIMPVKDEIFDLENQL